MHVSPGAISILLMTSGSFPNLAFSTLPLSEMIRPSRHRRPSQYSCKRRAFPHRHTESNDDNGRGVHIPLWSQAVVPVPSAPTMQCPPPGLASLQQCPRSTWSPQGCRWWLPRSPCWQVLTPWPVSGCQGSQTPPSLEMLPWPLAVALWGRDMPPQPGAAAATDWGSPSRWSQLWGAFRLQSPRGIMRWGEG